VFDLRSPKIGSLVQGEHVQTVTYKNYHYLYVCPHVLVICNFCVGSFPVAACRYVSG